MIFCLNLSQFGANQVLRNPEVGGGGQLSGKKHYGGVRFNIISVTRGWVGVKFPGKERYLTREWPLCSMLLFDSRLIIVILLLDLKF